MRPDPQKKVWALLRVVLGMAQMLGATMAFLLLGRLHPDRDDGGRRKLPPHDRERAALRQPR